MTNKKNMKSSRMNKINIPSEAQVYKGPLRLPLAREQAAVTVSELVQVVAATASAGGVINPVINLSLSSMTDAASYVAIYDEARLLSAEIEYVPNAVNTLSAANPLAGSPLVICLDRDSNSALGSLSGGFDFESSRVGAVNERFRGPIFKMSGSEDAGFVGSTTSSGFFKSYSAGNTANGNYGYFFVRSIFQFRGRL